MSKHREYRLVPVQDPDGLTHLRMVSPNGEIVMTSEKYQSLDNANRAADKIAYEGRQGFKVSPVIRSWRLMASKVWHRLATKRTL